MIMPPEITPNPLDIQELVERCIDCVGEIGNVPLYHRTHTLMSCALVCRSWVRAAQANLLRGPHATNICMFTSNRRLVDFHTTLTNFPRLIHHNRRLSIAVDGANRRAISQNTLQKMSGLPSTRLDSISALIRRRLYDHSPLQQLTSNWTSC
jgi:hypothetical protein